MSAKIERYYSSNRNLIASIELEDKTWLALVDCPFEKMDVLITHVDFRGGVINDKVLETIHKHQTEKSWTRFDQRIRVMFLELAMDWIE